jgi:DNA-binding beta-propeller fold protein YncE
MRIFFTILVIFTVLIFQGCSTKTVAVKPHIVFPPYPEDPKIVYLDTYRGGMSANQNETSALDLFLGETASKKSGSNIVKPYGVGLLNGKVYVADTGSDAVFVIDEKSKELSFLGTGVVGRLSSPVAIAFDAKGMTYVSDVRQKTIQGYDSTGKMKYVLGGRLEFVNPTGIAIDKKLHRLYVVDTKAHHIKAFDIESKKLLFTIGKRGKEDAEFNFPTNIAVDQRNSNMIVVDTQNFRVQIFDKDGNFIRRFGKIGDKPGMFARPKGVAVDSEGNIYVTDAAFNNIQIFNETGELLLYFGSGGYKAATFRLIAGIYIDENDKIVVADGFSGRVQLFQYLSKAWIAKNPQEYKKLKEFKPEM